MPSETKLKKAKVNPNSLNRLSELARWILRHTGDGIERGEIVARFYGLERLYCNFYVDPCYRTKERREHERRHRYAQPRVTMTLKRLDQRGLVQLCWHGKYVKEVRITSKGKAVARQGRTEVNMKGDT
jgi:hypothetical protein